MTKAEIRKAIKREFFTQVCEVYPGTVIDHSEGGRYCIDIPNEGMFELSGGDYWDICTYSIPWAQPSDSQRSQHERALGFEQILQILLNEVVRKYNG